MLNSLFSNDSKRVDILEGIYNFDSTNRTFTINSITFLVLSRKKRVTGKSDLYLIAKFQPVDKYISSLYPVPNNPNCFKIDFRFINYHLLFTNDSVQVIALSEKKRKQA